MALAVTQELLHFNDNSSFYYQQYLLHSNSGEFNRQTVNRQKLQSKSTLSCEIVKIDSLFGHGFIKKPKSKFNRDRK